MRFLVADDSKLARLSTIKSLTAQLPNAEIVQAQNGQEAIEAVKGHRIDVVFLDLTMPVMNGYEAIPEILAYSPSTKIIVVSADIQEKARERVINLGAQLHVQKPIDTSKMKEILEII
ncbi:MAG: response regulator [Epsilonproteobacteria bacterium]|nr:response regulator [Campylobacterota bacterium]